MPIKKKRGRDFFYKTHSKISLINELCFCVFSSILQQKNSNSSQIIFYLFELSLYSVRSVRPGLWPGRRRPRCLTARIASRQRTRWGRPCRPPLVRCPSPCKRRPLRPVALRGRRSLKAIGRPRKKFFYKNKKIYKFIKKIMSAANNFFYKFFYFYKKILGRPRRVGRPRIIRRGPQRQKWKSSY
jgi:hypothetical protein